MGDDVKPSIKCGKIASMSATINKQVSWFPLNYFILYELNINHKMCGHNFQDGVVSDGKLWDFFIFIPSSIILDEFIHDHLNKDKDFSGHLSYWNAVSRFWVQQFKDK